MVKQEIGKIWVDAFLSSSTFCGSEMLYFESRLERPFALGHDMLQRVTINSALRSL